MSKGTVDERLRAMLEDAARRLAAADARDEALAAWIPARRILLIWRQATFLPLGRVWRLGVLLLSRDGRLYATGSITRAVEPRRPNYQSISAEERRAYSAAAFRAGFAANDTVNFDAREIALTEEGMRASGLLFTDGDRILVRWDAVHASSAVDLSSYLDDRVALLTDPPVGA